MGSSQRAPRAPKNLDAGVLGAHIASFELHLHAEKKSDKTVRTYREAAQWMAAAHLLPEPTMVPATGGDEPAGLGCGKDDWADVTRDDIRRWIVWLLDTYSDSYANNQFRALQQFWKWWAQEEDLPNHARARQAQGGPASPALAGHPEPAPDDAQRDLSDGGASR
ncbi:hypothetical protein ACFOVU_19650 [Nocardiopsis sediminis]|uniref:Core-binding (CB) domain-containing protein n=1 Tax=Nocardiopsis sediminis TaxID=1778267 RepID=A0ABV8FQ11_9ACTN